MVGIERVKINFPVNSLHALIQRLVGTVRWTFAIDNKDGVNRFISDFSNAKNTDSGFSYTSFDRTRNICDHDILNTNAQIIFDLIQEKSKILNSKNIMRFFWNYYHRDSMCKIHTDNLNPKSTSIVYNIHSNTGGTEFFQDGKNEFIQSVQNEAIIFPSRLEHRGVAPKESYRFSLNIIVE
tara:strand:- start:342 stop:884 length:543 start_codon:yes stop_codon:yes gene_type:complete